MTLLLVMRAEFFLYTNPTGSTSVMFLTKAEAPEFPMVSVKSPPQVSSAFNCPIFGLAETLGLVIRPAVVEVVEGQQPQ